MVNRNDLLLILNYDIDLDLVSITIFNRLEEKVKRRILLVSNDGFENGGIQAVIMSIVRNLYTEYEFHCVVFSDGDQYYSNEFRRYGKIHHFKSYKGKNIVGTLFEDIINYKKYYKQLERLISQEGPFDVIHCHNYFMAAPFLKAAKNCGIQTRISHSHNVAPPYRRKNLVHNLVEVRLKVILHKYATDRVACSRAAGEYLFGRDAVRVINNAIDLDKFDPSKYNISGVQYTSFIHVGRYSFQKNQLFLLDVFKEYLKLDNTAKLTLIGFGTLENQVLKKVEDCGLSEYVTFLPPDSNIPEAYAKANAMIFPSTYEGLGISLIEAQAMGVRCYVSENIQPEANLGLCKQLNLSWGAKEWANFIYNDIKENGIEKRYVDLSSYDIKIIASEYSLLYSGN